MAPPEVAVELFLAGAWVDITTDVRVDPGLAVSFGLRGESGLADPCEARLVVNNTTGKYTPRNPVGPYYGLLKRNTPLRVLIETDVRFTGEVSEFPSRWDPSGGDVWEPLVASGALRRLLHSSVLNSPLQTFLSRLGVADGGTITGYWPMEDEPGSTQFASGLAGGLPLTITGTPGFAEIDGGAGSGPIAKMAGVQAQQFTVASDDEFTVGFLLNMPTGGTANGAVLARWTTEGTAHTWEVSYETGGLMRLRVYSGSAVLVLNTLQNLLLDGATRWVTIEAQQNGANVDWAFGATSPAGTALGTINTVTITSPGGVIVGMGNAITGDVGIGHVVLSNSNTTLFTYDFNLAVNGYAGESVEDRMERAADLAEVSMTVLEVAAPSALLGVQPTGSPLEVMRDAEAADLGILYDALSASNALVYRTRKHAYNSTPVLALNYAAGHLSPPLEPTDDDALLVNDVTATRPGGSSARAVDTSGPLSSLPSPGGVGPYTLSYSANVQTDAMLPYVASWLLARGTLDATRYPQVTVDLALNPSLVADVHAVRPGDLITISNLPVYAGTNLARLHVWGWSERVSSHTRTITFNCRPADAEDVIRLNDSTYGRLDAAASLTNEALDTTETGVDITGSAWITTAGVPADFPFDIVIGGEQMTVTSATGSVLTVTRSVNGVVKSHLTAQPVHLWRPMRLAL